jgi:Zn-dependent M16 (insulinase) family peptidase
MTHPQFTLIETISLPEYGASGLWLRHNVTGLEVFHIVNDDPENLFAFAFRSTPSSSNGVAHVMEHSVLCGSERYPLKDAFITASQASLSTFMNALTYPDRTVYPASTILESDYFNLMDVYADAVFFPLLKEEVFWQEGHRDSISADGKVETQGVVYSEMKGNYASPEDIIDDAAFHSLYEKGHPYSYDSGGDPRVIPELSYAEFLDFHKRSYHPSNCRVFLYGNIPTERQLDFLEERYLSRFGAGQAVPAIQPQVPFPAPRRIDLPYPYSETENKTTLLVSWLTVDSTDFNQLLAFEVLSEILLGHDGSAMNRALRESGLGEDVAPQSGYASETRQVSFTVGLRGIDKKDADKVESLVLDTLRRLASEGISAETIKASIRVLEFSYREIKRGSGPYSLRLLKRSLRGWVHGGRPDATLRYEPPFQALRESLEKNPRFFEDMIQRWLLDNSHRVSLLAFPVQEGELPAPPPARSASELSASEREAIDQAQKRLEAFQGAKDDPEVLRRMPRVRLQDLPREIERTPRVDARFGGAPCLYHPLTTNGIVYL